jgi:DnaK suppressor protein
MARMRGVDRARYRLLRRLLEERRREIQESLRSLREAVPAAADLVRDAEEQRLDGLFRDLDFALVQMKAASVAALDAAIERLEEGTYGTCADCGAEISPARLEAVPFAVRCVACQQVEEARHVRGARDEEARLWP